MIELVGLDKSFGGRRILTAASLEVQGGESVALVGANGSGKTTTLRCVLGLARADRGRISVDGIDMVRRPCDARARLSYLAQRTEFPSTLTVREILSVVADLRHASTDSVEREISLCGLARLADRTAARLSGGERQRVAMAALFLPDVPAYLLDEPTMNLDPIGTRLLVERLATLRAEGHAVLFTTHVTAGLDGLATRVMLLREGRIASVFQDVRQGERHVSIGVGEHAGNWVGAALRGEALRAWPVRDRLHAVVTDATLSTVLARLEHEGARIRGYRCESPLASALDRLNDEELGDDAQIAARVDRSVAVSQLWRGSSWARADSAGSR